MKQALGSYVSEDGFERGIFKMEGAAYEADTYTTEDAIENDSNLSQVDDQAAMYAPERYTENTAYDTDGYEPPDSAENAMYAEDGYAPENYGDNTEYTPEQ